MASNFSDDMQEPEPTIRLTRKQLLALEVSETLVDLLTFSGVQSNNTDAPEPTIRLTCRQLLALRVPETLVDLLTFSNVQSNEPALSVVRVSPGDQTEPRSAIEISKIELKLNDLPKLPMLAFEYLCFSKYPSGFIFSKNRWVTEEFAQYLIDSTEFGAFLQTSDQSILANLKHIRLCKLDLNTEDTPASFVRILNSFGQLEELDLFDIDRVSELGGGFQVRLNLPMLKNIQLVRVHSIEKLTLDAPRLENVKLVKCPDLKMELVSSESVEKLVIDCLDKMEVFKIKNLKYLYCGKGSRIDSTLLSTLEQLNEIHLNSKDNVSTLFQQKERYDRSILKIFLCGCLLNGPSDPAIGSLGYSNRGYLRYLAENPSKVAEEIPIQSGLLYSAFVLGLEIRLLKQFTDLDRIIVDKSVQNVDLFLQLLKNLNNITWLDFTRFDQPPELFKRLPDHCAIQYLGIEKAPADLDFLFRLKNLVELHLPFRIDIKIVRRVLEELPFFLSFYFRHLNKEFEIEIDHLANGSKQFAVSLLGREKTKVSDAKDAIQYIFTRARLV